MATPEHGEERSSAFEVEDEYMTMSFSELSAEDYVVLVVFWVLAFDIFLQFFTRYVLDDSLAWTEEIARYLLIVTGFVGSIMAVRKNTHIMVEFFYRYIPGLTARVLSFFIDFSRIGFFAILAWVSFKMAGKTKQMMVSIDVPKSAVYYIVSASFALMAVRAVQVAAHHWRQGGSDMALRCVERQRHLDEEAAS